MSIRYVALGDLLADYYYYDNTLSYVDGGGSKFNTLVNLAHLGNSTAVISACSKNKIGDMLIYGLSSQNIDTSDVLRISNNSRIYHLTYEKNGTFNSSKSCPICGMKTWYSKSFADLEYCISKVKASDIIIFDNLTEDDIELINSCQNEKIIDIGHKSMLYNFTAKLISATLCSKFEIIQINELVGTELINLFSLHNYMDLYFLLKPKVLIITQGKEGAEIIHDSFCYKKILTSLSNGIDTTGCGDTFLASFINEYYLANKKVDQTFIDNTFSKATKATSIVVQSYGARGHIYAGFKPIKLPSVCSCQDLLTFN